MVRISDIMMIFLTALLFPALISFGKALFSMRDSLRELNRTMGQAEPPQGVLGDLAHLKREAAVHRDWLIKSGIINPGNLD